MEVSKNTACLEITSDTAKFAMGYEIGGEPVLLYYAEKSIKGCVKDGQIVDPENLKKVIRQFIKIEDEAMAVKISATNISLILPPLGFQVYRMNKTTNVVALTGLVDRIDIVNVMSLVKKEQIPGGNVIVDIIPLCFVLADGRRYGNPPLGEKSDTLSVQTMLHTLPSKILDDYKRTVEEAGFRIRRSSVAPYCAAQLLKSDKNLPETYLYIDIGAHITTVSFIGNTSPYGSMYFLLGGDDLTQAIAERFGLSFADAELLKTTYGYDERALSYEAPLFTGVTPQGGKVSYYQKDLNAVLSTFFAHYKEVLANCLAKSYTRSKDQNVIASLPFIISGGGSKLHGLGKLLESATSGHSVLFYTPKVMGARDPRYANLLGQISAEGHYRGTLEENLHGVSTLTREKQ